MYSTLLAQHRIKKYFTPIEILRGTMPIYFRIVSLRNAHNFTKIIEKLYLEEARLVAEAVREINEKDHDPTMQT